MAAINLDSLSTFWTAIKNFFKTNSYESVVLYDGAASTNVDLSESIDNFERIEVTWQYDNDNVILKNEFVPSLTTTYFQFFSSWVNAGTNTWLKIYTWEIDSSRTNFTVKIATNTQFTFGTGSTVTRNVVTNFRGISKVVGINRIANN